ncbi:MAG: hypothetical protein N5P05_003884 [Chroococcopsis gigantea SAG 12.99]|jgi:alkylation response protein AidB-like acyl-CoA dehydrogenase|nr:acyl-CoA/acyl-ACP dehydrogenase [Chlorogloea purpurea SAG 13.99]MDV3002278.1 hypothetical protein [Chroococcopsis gigantea SAG 12.99]
MVVAIVNLIDTIEDFLINEIAPQAQLIDRDPLALKKALQSMGERSLLSLRIPQQWGGGGIDQLTYRQFQVLIARYSGALAFLQTQHQSAANQIFSGDNEDMKTNYLPPMARGETLIGIGVSHLRREGKPLVRAIPLENNQYRLTGEVPWVTGLGFFESFIIGATLPDGRSLYSFIPFGESRQETGGKIIIGEVMELAVMGVTRTVKVTLDKWIISEREVIKIKPVRSMGENDRENVLFHGYNALGCARAGLDILGAAYDKTLLDSIQQARKTLQARWDDCYQKMLSGEKSEFPYRLRLRAEAINLAFACSQAAVIVSGGGGNYLDHPAQRVYREALLYAVSGQTIDVMEASLQGLVNQARI